MDIVLKIDKLGESNIKNLKENKEITVTGEMISVHFFDGAVDKAFIDAQKFEDLKNTLTPLQKEILKDE